MFLSNKTAWLLILLCSTSFATRFWKKTSTKLLYSDKTEIKASSDFN